MVDVCTANEYVFVPVSDGVKTLYEQGVRGGEREVLWRELYEQDIDISDEQLAAFSVGPLASPELEEEHGNH